MKTFRFTFIALILLGFTMGVQFAPELYADYKEAYQKYQQGQYVEAAAAFRAEVEAFPNWWFVQYFLGQCNLKLEKYDQALIEYNKAKGLAQKPNELFETGYGIAQVYYKQNKLSAAIDELKAVEGSASSEDEKKRLYNLMGTIYYGQKKYGDAVPWLLKTAEVESGDSGLQFKIGYSYYSLGEYEKAYRELDKAVRTDSKNTTARYWMGITALTLGRTATSKSKKSEWYNKAVSQGEQLGGIKPNNADYISLTGQAYLGAKQYDKAIAEFSKALQVAPGDCQNQHNLANAFLGKKDWSGAETAFKKVLQCKPGDADANNSLGYIYEQVAIDFAKQAEKDASKYTQAIANGNLSLEHYRRSLQKKSSSAVSNAINRVQSNLDIYAENQATDAENRRIAEDNAKAKEYNKELVEEFGEEVLEAGEELPDPDAE